MSKFLYMKMAADNLKKNRQNILPYLLSCIGTVMMFFIMISISVNDGLNSIYGADYITSVTSFGVGIIGLFSVVFLIYSNSFLLKRRKKEFGLFHILGMEKKQIALILFWESLYLAAAALAAGIGLGILLYRLMFLILGKLSGIDGTIGFQFDMKALLWTVALILGISLINFLTGLGQIRKSEPVELLKGDQFGEKEPKARALTVLTGLLTLGAGYYLAVTCDNSLEAFSIFFVAIALVAVGTHCLFSAGSIAVLKMMKKSKRYYYQMKHFIGVSGMLYRMKQNAAGLANICILSTGVLLVVSITACMWVGSENALENRYPSQITVNSDEISKEQIEKELEMIRQNLTEQGIAPVKVTDARYLFATVFYDSNRFYVPDGGTAGIVELNNTCALTMLTAEDYERWTGESISVSEGTVVVIPEEQGKTFDYDSVQLGSRSWKVRTEQNKVLQEENAVIPGFYLVFSSEEERISAMEALGQEVGYGIRWSYGMDFALSPEEQIAVGENLESAFDPESGWGWIEIREKERGAMESIYGSILFFRHICRRAVSDGYSNDHLLQTGFGRL